MKSSRLIRAFAGLLAIGGLWVLGWSAGQKAKAEVSPAPPTKDTPHHHHAERPAIQPAAAPPQSSETEAVATAVEAPRPGRLPPPKFHPRDPKEWQGMLVDLTMQPPCMESAQCGHAMACQTEQNRCGPCTTDRDCAVDEACALDHCVKSHQVECRSKDDCGLDELCVLSGLTGADPRGNRDMRAYCLSKEAGDSETQPDEEHPESEATASTMAAEVSHPTVYGKTLLDDLREEVD